MYLGVWRGDTLEVQNSMNDQLSLFDNGVNNIIQIGARSFTICIVFYLYFALNPSTTLNEWTSLRPMGKMKSFLWWYMLVVIITSWWSGLSACVLVIGRIFCRALQLPELTELAGLNSAALIATCIEDISSSWFPKDLERHFIILAALFATCVEDISSFHCKGSH